jgi:glycerol-3-phosphate cytidylyltransferase-like family protein
MHKESKKTTKTNEDRLVRIQQLCEENIGSVRSVSLKLKGNAWTCALKMVPDSHFDIIASTDDDPTVACKMVKKRLKKIINRYQNI